MTPTLETGAALGAAAFVISAASLGVRPGVGLTEKGNRIMQMTAAQIARVVHEANRALQIEQADPTIPVSVSWDDLDDETRRSAVEGVQGVINGNTPEESHESWVLFKLEHGWTLGPIKDESKKEHPLLVPYADLPETQKIKDALFVNIVRTLTSG